MITVDENDVYSLKNDGNNQNIYPDTPIYLSIQGIPNQNSFKLKDIELRGIVLAYGLTEDKDSNGVPDHYDFISGMEEIVPVTPSPTDIPIETPVPTITDTPSDTPKPTEVEEIDYYLDSDEDGLSNYAEDLYGTDKNDPDSDDDNINDYLEIILGLNPICEDSDNNGKMDGEEDSDGDGLTNLSEIEFGTDLQMEDSDLDELTDYEEIYLYGTDPNDDDSNDDGITDGDAVFLGFDPILLDSDGNGIPDSQEKIHQEVSFDIHEPDDEHDVFSQVKIEGKISNRADSVLSVKNVYRKNEYVSDIPAQVGVPLEIECRSDFDNLTITLYYDENKLGDTKETDLGIYWLDEESGMLVIVDSEVDIFDNTISFVTDHLSTWVPFDYKKDKEFWEGTAYNFSVMYDTKENSTKEGTLYTLMVQFGISVTDDEKSNTMRSIADLMSYINEEDRVVVYAYNTSDVSEQYNYLILGDWDEEYKVQLTKFYKKSESADLLLAVHNILYGNYKENYYANLATINGNNGKEIDFDNYDYKLNNHIEADKEAEATEEASNALWRAMWYYAGFEFRFKMLDLNMSNGQIRQYENSVTRIYKENDDYYFHIAEHENVCIVFANGTQYLTTDNYSPLDNDGNWRDFNCYFANYCRYNLQLYLISTGNDNTKLNLDDSLDGHEGDNEYMYGLWPYTHGGFIDLSEGEFGSLFKKYRELNAGLDADGDGLWDINEERGMLGANGKLLKSDPTTKQSDDDGLSDDEEMGDVYTIIVHSFYDEESDKTITKMEINGHPADDLEMHRFSRFYKIGSGMWTIYCYKSNPKEDDTDGDFYNDQNDSKPLSNCIETYDLGGGEFDVFGVFEDEINGFKYNTTITDEGYVHVKNVPNKGTKKYYGGDQGWFSTKEEKLEIGDKTIKYSVYIYEGKTYLILEEGGCGLIALNDVLLYKTYGGKTFDFSDYEESLFSVIDSCEPHFDYLIGDDNNLVFPAPISVDNVSEVLKDKGYNNSIFKYLGNREGMLNKIVNSIEKGNPVILNQLDIPGLLYNFISEAETAEKNMGFPLYKLSCRNEDYGKGVIGVPEDDDVMTDHYVTITGVILDRESEKEWLRIQSWGEQYYILFEDFCNYNEIFDWAEGTIIVIK